MIRRLVVGSIVSAEAGEDQGLAREQEQERERRNEKKTRASGRENYKNEHTRGSVVGVCTESAAAEGITGLVVLAEATAAEPKRHVGDGARCSSPARH